MTKPTEILKHATMTDSVTELMGIARSLHGRIHSQRRHTARLEEELKAVQEKIERLTK